ncbi:MAG: carotenoid 1,2-hydratase [Maricaulaceae bacterium]
MDAVSDDGRCGLSVIAFVGSVFSPYYYWAGRKQPENHVAFNVALYTPKKKYWTMTERSRSALDRDAARFAVGPSAMAWDGQTLRLELNERTTPWFQPLRGTITLHAEALNPELFTLDAHGRHRWRPIAPFARVEVDFTHPALRFKGHGYFDTNEGDEPMEAGFDTWDWSRASLSDGAGVLYDVIRKGGERASLAFKFDKSGRAERFDPPLRRPLPGTFWGVDRAVQAETEPKLVRTLEDTPFYVRSQLETTLLGETVEAVHESMSLPRFASPIVKLMLPFRMPRLG